MSARPANFSPHAVYLSPDPQEAALIERCIAGDTSAFEPLVDRYQRVLFNVALRMLGNRDDASDATQNTFVKAYQALASYDPGQRFFSWIYRILRNECLNALRGRRPEEPLTPDVAVASAAFAAVESGERRRAVELALLALPHEYCEVVVLRHYAGLSYQEMAATLGIPEKTVKSRLYTARQRLGQLLLDWRANA